MPVFYDNLSTINISTIVTPDKINNIQYDKNNEDYIKYESFNIELPQEEYTHIKYIIDPQWKPIIKDISINKYSANGKLDTIAIYHNDVIKIYNYRYGTTDEYNDNSDVNDVSYSTTQMFWINISNINISNVKKLKMTINGDQISILTTNDEIIIYNYDIDYEKWNQNDVTYSNISDFTQNDNGNILSLVNNNNQVYIYDLSNNNLNLLGQELSGSFVSMNFSGNTISLVNNDEIIVYDLSDNWNQLGQELSGSFVSMNANGDILSLIKNNKVFVYKLYNNNNWNQIGEELSGNNVNINYDGTMISVIYNNEISVYEYTDKWTQIGNSITETVNQSYINYNGDIVSFNSVDKLYIYTIDKPNKLTTTTDNPLQINKQELNTSYQIGFQLINGITEGITTYHDFISDLCFVENTPIHTDQGIIHIQDLKPNINTINNKYIKHITKTLSIDDKLVRLRKNCIGKNIPCKDTIISKNHKIFYNGLMVKASYLVGIIEKIEYIDYNGEYLYNILMDEYNKVLVNNLICETLDPNNTIAQLYNSKK